MSIRIGAPAPFGEYDNFAVYVDALPKQRSEIFDVIQGDVLFLDPHRDLYVITSYDQPILTTDIFRESLEWEFRALIRADLVVLHLRKTSPCLMQASMLQIGLLMDSGKLMILCDPEFAAKVYVELLCKKNSIPLVFSLEDLCLLLKNSQFFRTL